MRRITHNGYTCFICFHTQEYRPEPLEFPIKCTDEKAWLGPGFYFWFDELFAIYWGHDFKKKTGYFDVYTAHVEDNRLLNASFSEKDYFFLKNNIDKLIARLRSEGLDFNLKEVHRLLKEEFWSKMGINGIIYDDLPVNNYKKSRTYSLIEPLYYVKRIQVVVFNPDIIHSFEEHLIEQKCK